MLRCIVSRYIVECVRIERNGGARRLRLLGNGIWIDFSVRARNGIAAGKFEFCAGVLPKWEELTTENTEYHRGRSKRLGDRIEVEVPTLFRTQRRVGHHDEA